MSELTQDLDRVVAACLELIESRFPGPSDRGAAAMLLGNGSVLTGTAPDALNPSVELCHEVGPYCEAFRLGQPVVASVCLHRMADGGVRVLSPCGVCLERLAVHGGGVLLGVPTPGLPGTVRWVTLREAHPYYWMKVFPDELAAEAPGWD